MHYVLSDIHGNLRAFESILSQIEFNANDTLYVLGDVSDRHPDGLEILRWIMKTPNVHMLLGNHELIMLDALGFAYDDDSVVYISSTSRQQRVSHWYRNGGKVTHKALNALSRSARLDIVAYITSLPLNIDVTVNGRKFRLVHGTSTEIYDDDKYQDLLASTNHKREGRTYFCVWDRDTVLKLADREDCITIFGHTPVLELPGGSGYSLSAPPMEIFRDRNVIGVDCGSGWPDDSPGRLACLRLEDLKEFYSCCRG